VIDVLPQIGLVVVLIALNAMFAGTELALVSLSEGQLQRLESRSATGAQLARLAREPNRFLATIQIGITLAGFLASAAAAVSLAEPLQGPLGFLGDAARPVSIICVTLILTYLTLVFGELAPKRIAMQRAEKWAMAAARPLAILTAITRPAVWLLSRTTDIAVRLIGADPTHQRSDVTDEELRDMVAAHETLTPEQRRIMDGAFHVAQRTLTKVLVPRTDVYIIDADSPFSYTPGRGGRPTAALTKQSESSTSAGSSPPTRANRHEPSQYRHPCSLVRHESSPQCATSRPNGPRWPSS
jgi:putative hemolysin